MAARNERVSNAAWEPRSEISMARMTEPVKLWQKSAIPAATSIKPDEASASARVGCEIGLRVGLSMSAFVILRFRLLDQSSWVRPVRGAQPWQ
jgi:hypothetical protein